jgi:beta-glucanase (GH16 family)
LATASSLLCCAAIPAAAVYMPSSIWENLYSARPPQQAVQPTHLVVLRGCRLLTPGL